MSEEDPLPVAYHLLAGKLQTAGIDGQALKAEREARQALLKAENPNVITLSDMMNEDDSDKQLAQMDQEYAQMKMEADAAAKKKEAEMTQLVDTHFPPPPMKET